MNFLYKSIIYFYVEYNLFLELLYLKLFSICLITLLLCEVFILLSSAKFNFDIIDFFFHFSFWDENVIKLKLELNFFHYYYYLNIDMKKYLF